MSYSQPQTRTQRQVRPPQTAPVFRIADEMGESDSDVEQPNVRASHAPPSIMPRISSSSRLRYGKKQARESKGYGIKDDSTCSPRNINFRKSIFISLAVVGILYFASIAMIAARFHRHHDVDSMGFMLRQYPPLDVDTSQFDATKNRFRPLLPPKLPPLLRPHSIPLPLPPNKVSVVLINYSRPRMIRDSSLMRTLLSHPNVDEVLLLHANPKTAFEFVHDKVVNIDATQHNDEMGLSLRFYFCQLAKNDWVLHVDDDMEFPSSTLSELLIEYHRNTKRIVGRFGRDLIQHNSFNGYNSQNTHKTTEVILTKLMVMERDTCGSFFEYASLVWDDVILNSGEGPLWNGEDIFMSLVANHVYSGQHNYAMDWLDVWQAPDSLKDYDNGKLDISGGMSGFRFWDWHWYQSILRRNRHYSYRGKLWHVAKERLDEIPPVEQKETS